ncbi:ATP-dependent (S)-NAD(P)H-hydrate dehydratase [Pseudodesulfovibrio hydrargyri]|uniref:ATP-dependent (S)-NAD(P)H-hydrate dehydratase n=1 Tax=Pseudodesulfovibrio hydrargyri TaxID=2125990 RepID=A0A1J5NE86_9BACT|nr:NAD(P)H-hydrate dehydratase [Pseudodesulfovibrio hydrargyri]OIQ50025.1 ATP-dependent (S)-NAD(P)H-hydrate dehydratase [Pseudodesulfovibrio hydrargyri]
MLIVVGTIPDPAVPVLDALAEVAGDGLTVGGRALAPDRGTPALLAAAAVTCDFLGANPPHALLAGDEGLGNGSRELYRRLVEVLPARRCAVLAFHYLQPDVDWHNRVLMAAQSMAGPPALVADAGFMYAAKMSGYAGEYALFTPDAGELAFLADEAAPHPFYTRGFILQDEDRVPELINRAYDHDNAARCLLVKGRVDRVADRTGVLAEVTKPSVEAMEAMGGTGDTVTGMACALMAAGLSAPKAAHVAAQANRYAGEAARPTPASQIGELIPHIPQALSRAMGEIL